MRPYPPCPHTQSLPLAPLPQVQSVRSVFTATLWYSPPVVASQLVRVPTCAGEERATVEVSPSWPSALRPHVQSVPSPLTASECSYPADTCDQLVAAPTCAGEERSVATALLCPSLPVALSPHVQSSPTPLRWSRSACTPIQLEPPLTVKKVSTSKSPG